MGFAAVPQAPQPADDVEMAPQGGLPADVEAKITETNQTYVVAELRR